MKGKLEDVSLTNLVQIIGQSGMSGHLNIVSEDNQANLYFSDGNMVDAKYEDIKGENAFFEILKWKIGDFEMLTGIEASEISITKTWSDLLLSGLKRIDESSLKGDQIDETQKISPDDLGELFGLNKKTISQNVLQEKTEDEMSNKMQETLAELGQETAGLIATFVIGLDGLGVAGHTAVEVDADMLNAQVATLFKLVKSANQKMSEANVKDFLITTERTYVLLQSLEDEDYFLGLVCDRSSANLGNMRLMSRTYAGRLSAAMPR